MTKNVWQRRIESHCRSGRSDSDLCKRRGSTVCFQGFFHKSTGYLLVTQKENEREIRIAGIFDLGIELKSDGPNPHRLRSSCVSRNMLLISGLLVCFSCKTNVHFEEGWCPSVDVSVNTDLEKGPDIFAKQILNSIGQNSLWKVTLAHLVTVMRLNFL